MMPFQKISLALALGLTLAALVPVTTLAQERDCVSEIERPPVVGPRTPPGPPAVRGTTVLDRTNLTLPGTAEGMTVPLRLEAGHTYVIETHGLTVSTDTVLEIRRATAAAPSASDPVVGQNDDVQSGVLWSRVRFTPGQSGDYYARVRAYDPTTGGTFSLRVVEPSASTSSPLTGPK